MMKSLHQKNLQTFSNNCAFHSNYTSNFSNKLYLEQRRAGYDDILLILILHYQLYRLSRYFFIKKKNYIFQNIPMDRHIFFIFYGKT